MIQGRTTDPLAGPSGSQGQRQRHGDDLLQLLDCASKDAGRLETNPNDGDEEEWQPEKVEHLVPLERVVLLGVERVIAERVLGKVVDGISESTAEGGCQLAELAGRSRRGREAAEERWPDMSLALTLICPC